MMKLHFYVRGLLIALCLFPALVFAQVNSTGNNASTNPGAVPAAPAAAPNIAPTSLPTVNAPSTAAPGKVNPATITPSPAPVTPAPTPATASAPAATTPAAVVSPPAPPAPMLLQEDMPAIPNGKKIDPGALLLSPIHAGDTSLMFTPEEIQLIAPFFVLYDGNKDNTQQNKSSNSQDDLSSLLDTIKSQSKTAQPELPKVLPNIYLGSIVYYSPTQWSIWLNGKKLINSRNAPENALYIPRISRNEIELVWKPPSLLDTPITWGQMTENGQKPLENIFVDKDKGTITVHLRPNQTFISSRLMIHEGLVRTSTPAPPPSQ